MYNFASHGYTPVGSYLDNSNNYASPNKESRGYSLRYLDSGKQFDSLIDTHNYEEYREKLQQSLGNNNYGGSQLNQTQGSTSPGSNFILKELELRIQEYQRLLKFSEDELNKSKLKLVDQKAYYEELLKEKDKRIEDYQLKEKQFYKKMMTPNASQQEIITRKEIIAENQPNINDFKSLQSPISDVQELQKNQSQKTFDSLPLSLPQPPVDKFYKYDIQIKKLEIAIAQKDLEISNLSQEVNSLKQTIDYKVHLELKDRQRREEFESSMGQLPFVAENQDLKRQNSAFKVENSKLKKALKENKAKLELYEQQNSSLTFKISEYIQMEKIKMEEQYNQNSSNKGEQIIKVSEDRNLLDGILGIMQYIRQSLCEIMFELFVRSGNIAFQRKANSFTIFQVNMKEVFGPESRGFVIPLYLYKKIKSLVKIYYPDYGETATLDDEMYKVATGETSKEVDRTEVNKWVINSIDQIKKKSAKNKNTSREQNDLFRFLALLYRTRYPLQGSFVDIDPDIQIKLEDSIVDTMLKLSIEEQPEEEINN